MSLYINGTKVIEGKFIDGKSTLPSISFITDPDSGFYRIGANNIGLALNSVKLVDWTSTLQTLTRSSLGTTTDATLYLTTSTAADAGAQQVSPSLLQRGYGWKTDATAGSQAVDFQTYVLPIQGTSAPSATQVIQYRVNDGSWSSRFGFNSAGTLYVGGASGTTASGTIVAGSLQATSNAGAIIRGVDVDDANAIALQVGNFNTLTTPGGKIVSFYSDNMITEKVYIDYRGAYSQSSALALGTTTIPMLTLANTTAAAAGAQQVSPSILLRGYGWKTDATAASQSCDIKQYVLPVQGAAAPVAGWVLASSVNGGADANLITANTGGINLNYLTYLNENTVLASNRALYIGSGTSSGLIFSTPQTVDSTMMFLDSTSRSLLVTDNANKAKDHDHTGQTNPTIFVHSATDPDSANNQWISLSHDQTDGIIAVGTGLVKTTANMQATTLTCSSTTAGIILSGSVNNGVIYANTTTNQSVFGVGANLGRQLILTDAANRSSDHDHDAQTNPTLYVHSATDPDSNNTQWGSLAHDKTDFVVATGTGTIKFNNSTKINGGQSIKRTATGAADYNPSALTTDYLIAVDNTAAARAVIISSEDVASGTTAIPRVFEIVDESGACSVNNITISLESGGTINGQASIVLKSDYESGRLIITGTNGVFI